MPRLQEFSGLCQSGCLCGARAPPCFHLDCSGNNIFTCLVLGDLSAKENALGMWVMVLCTYFTAVFP